MDQARARTWDGAGRKMGSTAPARHRPSHSNKKLRSENTLTQISRVSLEDEREDIGEASRAYRVAAGRYEAWTQSFTWGALSICLSDTSISASCCMPVTKLPGSTISPFCSAA
ncbi:hypothetical protein G6F59_017209 [Rhizopus arrhizus]|nr:hypothetical protein G6F59_017209 [Rhizopus arrhizus]